MVVQPEIRTPGFERRTLLAVAEHQARHRDATLHQDGA
jgi:hypothetical protein